ncbi:MAG: type II toxin-antitoxin system HicB family antitoxin [Thermodesulfobacteriota bacterium]
MKTLDYTAVVWKEESQYVSKCPELGVASCGGSFEEAINNLKEAVELYVENARELGLMEDIQECLVATEKYTARLQMAF